MSGQFKSFFTVFVNLLTRTRPAKHFRFPRATTQTSSVTLLTSYILSVFSLFIFIQNENSLRMRDLTCVWLHAPWMSQATARGTTQKQYSDIESRIYFITDLKSSLCASTHSLSEQYLHSFIRLLPDLFFLVHSNSFLNVAFWARLVFFHIFACNGSSLFLALPSGHV